MKLKGLKTGVFCFWVFSQQATNFSVKMKTTTDKWLIHNYLGNVWMFVCFLFQWWQVLMRQNSFFKMWVLIADLRQILTGNVYCFIFFVLLTVVVYWTSNSDWKSFWLCCLVWWIYEIVFQLNEHIHLWGEEKA